MSTALAWVSGRLGAVVVLVMLVAAGGTSTVPNADHWIGSWKQALDVGTGATVFIGPVAAGVACLSYARLRGSAMDDVLRQSVFDWWRWLQPLMAVWFLASLALTLVVLGATTLARMNGVPSAWSSAWIVVPAFGVLAGQAAVGAAIGYASGRLWTTPAAAVLVFLLFLWTTVGPMPDFFDTGGARGSRGGAVYLFWPAAAVGLAGIALAGVVVIVAHRRVFLATATRRVVAVGVAALWVAGWWFTPADAGDRSVEMADPPRVCAGAQPEVCVLADLPLPLKDLARKVDHQAEALRALDVTLPDRFVVIGPTTPRPGEGWVQLLEDEVHRTVDVDRATDTLVRPALCPGDRGDEPPYVAFDARRQLGRWLQFRAGLIEPDPRDGDHDWLHGDREVQEAWVRTTYRQLAECRYDEIRLHG